MFADGLDKIYDFKKRSDEASFYSDEPSRTVQDDLEDSDINTIVFRFGITGTMPQGVKVPEYGDFEEVFDFRTAQDAIVYADRQFMSMPASVRARFNNDPAVFMDFAVDPSNVDEMVRLGLAVAKPVVDTPVPAPVEPS
ncbi:MAG: internal scaffolding protein [Microvirus sp.]|nr:MAG: internal scaffolding protein [Microvirus sp.]